MEVTEPTLTQLTSYSSFMAFEISGGLESCTTNRTHWAYPECAGSTSTSPTGFPVGPAADPSMSWLYSAPLGLRRFLNHLPTLFPSLRNSSILISEFGIAEPFESRRTIKNEILWDLRRADYFQSYLDEVLLAVTEDGVNVEGTWGWAIFDNFEWSEGTNARFGLQYVDYGSETLERTPKASFFQFVGWFREHEGVEGNSSMRIV
jgi:beta-glucosidase